MLHDSYSCSLDDKLLDGRSDCEGGKDEENYTLRQVHLNFLKCSVALEHLCSFCVSVSSDFSSPLSAVNWLAKSTRSSRLQENWKKCPRSTKKASQLLRMQIEMKITQWVREYTCENCFLSCLRDVVILITWDCGGGVNKECDILQRKQLTSWARCFIEEKWRHFITSWETQKKERKRERELEECIRRLLVVEIARETVCFSPGDVERAIASECFTLQLRMNDF